MIGPGILTLISALDAGLVTISKVVTLVREARDNGQDDISDEQLASIDLKRDATHADFQDALQRKREREAAGG